MTTGAPGAVGEERSAEALRTFGRYLHRERELRGLSREEVARFTKLAPSVIDALESGEPAQLPPRAYVFGYLRSYSSAVGLDADEVVLRFQEVVDSSNGSKADVGAGRRRPLWGQRRWLWAAALALLAAAMVAIGLWRAPHGSGEIRGRRSPEKATYQVRP